MLTRFERKLEQELFKAQFKDHSSNKLELAHTSAAQNLRNILNVLC